MKQVIDIDNQEESIYITIKTNLPNKFLITASDFKKPNSFYARRKIDVKDSRTIFLSFPVSPKKIELCVKCLTDVENTQFLVDVKRKSLKHYDIFLDADTKGFLDLAVPFAQVCGFEAPAPNGRIFQSPDKKFNIKYFPVIKDYQTGKFLNTPARIGHRTGIIEVSAASFVKYTVPMRMMILLHEFSHKWKNPKMNLPISDEVGADINALYIYLGLGWSKVDAIFVYANVFLKAQTPQNIDRMRKIMNYIQKFEQGDYAKVA
jgi:hypothetical protein